jgi:hypothetical protein
VDLLISTTLFVLWALAFAVLGLSSSVTLGKVRGFLALRKSLGCLFDPSPLAQVGISTNIAKRTIYMPTEASSWDSKETG